MTINSFIGDQDQRSFDLIPAKTLAYGILRVRPYSPEHGQILRPGKNGAMIDAEVEITHGPYAGRRVWTYINILNENATARNIARAQIKAILEYAFGASSSNPTAYEIPWIDPTGPHTADNVNWMHLDQREVAIEIGVEKGGPDNRGGHYPDRNRITLFLSPACPEHAAKLARLQQTVSGIQPAQPSAMPTPQPAAQPSGHRAPAMAPTQPRTAAPSYLPPPPPRMS